MKKNIINKTVLILGSICIILPILNLIIWSFTERWAWPDLLPQTYSLRAINEIFSRKSEMIKLFMSSIFLSFIVALLSVIIGLMTARAFVLYDFKWKKQLYFFTLLPFLIPSTVFGMGIHVIFIKWGFYIIYFFK